MGNVQTRSSSAVRRTTCMTENFIPRLHDRANIEQLYMLAGRASSSSQLYRVNGALQYYTEVDDQSSHQPVNNWSQFTRSKPHSASTGILFFFNF